MFKYIILIAAILLAGCAAVFSILGISQLFVGASLITGIMASSIELGKIVSVSALYRYWHTLPRVLRAYLFGAVIVASAVTSAGIYGFLSSAYAAGSSEIHANQNQLISIDTVESLAKQSLQKATVRADHLQAIQSQQENRVDSLIAKNKSTSTQQSMMRQTNTELSKLQVESSDLTKEIDSLELARTQITTSIRSTGKIGSFYFVAKSLNISLDTVVIWFILILVLIFDPLSISLFLMYNIANTTIVEPSIEVSNNGSEPNREVNGPYYMQSDYDWKHDQRWRTDNNARAYYGGLGIKPDI